MVRINYFSKQNSLNSQANAVAIDKNFQKIINANETDYISHLTCD